MRCFCCWICNFVLTFMLSNVPVRLKCDSIHRVGVQRKFFQEKNVVKVKDEFSWKSFGTIPGKYLKCTLAKKEQVLQRMRLGVFRMFYTNNCIFSLAAEF